MTLHCTVSILQGVKILPGFSRKLTKYTGCPPSFENLSFSFILNSLCWLNFSVRGVQLTLRPCGRETHSYRHTIIPSGLMHWSPARVPSKALDRLQYVQNSSPPRTPGQLLHYLQNPLHHLRVPPCPCPSSLQPLISITTLTHLLVCLFVCLCVLLVL